MGKMRKMLDGIETAWDTLRVTTEEVHMTKSQQQVEVDIKTLAAQLLDAAQEQGANVCPWGMEDDDDVLGGLLGMRQDDDALRVGQGR